LWGERGLARLTRFLLVALAGLLDAPAGHFDLFADAVVAELLRLHALEGAPVPMGRVPHRFGDPVLYRLDDVVLDLACCRSPQSQPTASSNNTRPVGGEGEIC